jgi:alanyl aminopeptidase
MPRMKCRRLLPATPVFFVSPAGLLLLGVCAGLLGPGPVRSARAEGPAAPRAAEPRAAEQAPTLRLPKLATPQRYALDLTLVPSEDTFSGRIDIELDVLTPTPVLWLNKGPELTVLAASLTPGGAKGSAAAELPARAVGVGKDFLSLTFAHPLPVGPARLRISYRGKLPMHEDAGLYRERDGNDLYIYSDFEPLDARRAWPCFDEPSYKVPWQLTLHVRREHVALTNTPIESEHEEPGGWKRVVFRPTKPLPSYLLALAVGPFGIVDAGPGGQKHTPVRIITLRGHEAEAHYAAQVTPQILGLLEQYLGQPYAYEKLDQIAVPGKRGAMENPGLVTYGQGLIQIKPDEETVMARRRYARVCTHELAHQWTGDLVTMAFWDDLWLNESLADFIMSKVVDRFQPSWEEVIERTSSRLGAMTADSLASARKIRQPIESNDDIVNAFDGITYAKGMAVLLMFESWISEPVFQRGLARYLREHAHKNATAGDFIAALAAEVQSAEASTPAVAETPRRAEVLPAALQSFLDQPGVPMVSLALQCDAGAPRLRLSQQRYLPLGAEADAEKPPAAYVYKIPVCIRYRVAGQDERKECRLLDTPRAEWPLPGASRCPEYVVGNAGSTGYYRVSYQGELLARLQREGLRPGAKLLSEAEKTALLGDLAALLRSGQMTAEQALPWVALAAPDPSRHVIGGAARLALAVSDIVTPELRPRYERFLRQSFAPQLRALGLRVRPSDDDNTRLLRVTLLRLVLSEGREPTLGEEARGLLRGWLADRKSLDPESAQQLLAVATVDGDRALWEALHQAARSERDRTERGRLISAMAGFGDPVLATAGMALILGDEFPIAEAMPLLWGPLSHAGTRRLPLEYVQRNFDALVGRLPREAGAGLARVGTGVCSAPERGVVAAYFGGRSTRYTGGPRVLRQTLETISTCTALAKAQQPSLTRFLATY